MSVAAPKPIVREYWEAILFLAVRRQTPTRCHSSRLCLMVAGGRATGFSAMVPMASRPVITAIQGAKGRLTYDGNDDRDAAIMSVPVSKKCEMAPCIA